MRITAHRPRRWERQPCDLARVRFAVPHHRRSAPDRPPESFSIQLGIRPRLDRRGVNPEGQRSRQGASLDIGGGGTGRGQAGEHRRGGGHRSSGVYVGR